MGLDLHTHSKVSDGTLSPADLVKAAFEAGLDGMALTDHDSVGGLEEALRTGEAMGMAVVPGIELTTDYRDEEVHILGYGIDYHRPQLLEKLQIILKSRIERAEGILKRLERTGIRLTMDQVRSFATGDFVGRPHIYQAMKVYGGIGEDPTRKAFDHYLGSRGLAYLPHREIDPFQAITLIREAGGIPVLAHPGRVGRPDFLRVLVDGGLGGIEGYYPTHTPAQVRQFTKLAGDFHLIITGGSDFHGHYGGTPLGASQAPTELLPHLLHKD